MMLLQSVSEVVKTVSLGVIALSSAWTAYNLHKRLNKNQIVVKEQ